jgi:DivIVA domain-containing protein
MDEDDPEQRIAELERQQRYTNPAPRQDYIVQRSSQSSGTDWTAHIDPAGRPQSRPGDLTADDVHNVAFSKAAGGNRGYNEDEVEAFRERVEQRFRNPHAVGGLTAAEVGSVAFSKPAIGKRGYDQDEVDEFLERVGQQLMRTNGFVEHHVKPGIGDPADIGPQPRHAGSGRQRWRDGIWRYVAAIIVVMALIPFGVGAHIIYMYLSGTPTTATIVRCHKQGTRSLIPTCTATWSVDGESHTGTISGHVGGYPRGSVVNVHVHGSGAYTATSGFLYFAFGTPLLIIFVVPFLFFLFGAWRGRTGAVSVPGRHSRR